MTQTFIDMLVAIKDPAAIERAYNILAAKRELLAAERNTVKTHEFTHTFMEPKPILKTGSKYNDFGADDLVEFAGATPELERRGFFNKQRFVVIRKHRYHPEKYIVCKCVITEKFASINVANLKNVTTF